MTILELNGNLEQNLVEIVGKNNVSSQNFVLLSYSEDASPFKGQSPQIVVRPETTEQISEIMKLASSLKIQIVPVGGRSSINGSPIPRVTDVIMLDLTAMTKVLELNEDHMTITVQTGITWSELIHILKARGYKLGFRGPYGGNAGTVGGSLSSNSIGCGASRYGSVCNNITGIQVVLSSGEIVNTGSNWKISTNNKDKGSFARYCTFNDLTGIFLGDHGSLAVKTLATLKIYPLAKGIAYSDFGFQTIEQAAKAFHEIQSNHLVEEAVMLGDANSIELLASSYRDTFNNLECVLAVIIEEANDEIAKLKRELCEKIARKYGGKSIGQFLSKAHWLNMFNLVQSLFEEGFWFNTCHMRPISTLPTLINKFQQLAIKYKLKENGFNWIISALGVEHCLTSGWITIYMKDHTKEKLMYEIWDELREIEMELGGVPYWTGKLWEPYVLARVDPNFYELLRTLKNALDPEYIIHPMMFNLTKK